MRKLIYYVATTLDGFIATPSGGYDVFLFEGPQAADILADFPETMPAPFRAQAGLTTPNQVFDTVLMGRETYEVGRREGLTSPYPHLEQYVFSRTFKHTPDRAVALISDDALGAVRTMKQRPGRAIWLCGGGRLAAELLSEIDEVILKVSPVVIGAGIPLFSKAIPATRLKPLERKVYDNGFQRVHYAVQR